MSKSLLLERLASIVTTLAETKGSPESMLYIFCDMDMQAYETVRNAMVVANLVTISGHFVTLTPKGEMLAKQIEDLLAKKGK